MPLFDRKRTWIFWGALVLSLSPGCLKPTPDEIYQKDLDAQVAKMEHELKAYDEHIKSAPNAGGVNELLNARDLLRSRIERIKAKRKQEVLK